MKVLKGFMKTIKFLVCIFSLGLFANSALATSEDVRRFVLDKREILPDCEEEEARKGERCQEYINAVNSLTGADFLMIEKVNSVFRNICDYKDYFSSAEFLEFCNPAKPKPPEVAPTVPVVEEPSSFDKYYPVLFSLGASGGVISVALVVLGVARILL